MISPRGHRVLIRPDPIETKSAGGILLVQDERLAKSNVNKGILVAAGPQAWKAFGKDFSGEPWAEVGDHIYYSRHAGAFVEDPEDNEVYVIANDEDVNAVITGE